MAESSSSSSAPFPALDLDHNGAGWGPSKDCLPEKVSPKSRSRKRAHGVGATRGGEKSLGRGRLVRRSRGDGGRSPHAPVGNLELHAGARVPCALPTPVPPWLVARARFFPAFPPFHSHSLSRTSRARLSRACAVLHAPLCHV
jgi:hypothetical protein